MQFWGELCAVTIYQAVKSSGPGPPCLSGSPQNYVHVAPGPVVFAGGIGWVLIMRELNWAGKTIAERFWQQVDAGGSGCWEWTGRRSTRGYGIMRVRGKVHRMHRLSWELHYGPIPPGSGYHGTCVLHKCDNRACVRPDHLFLGTNADNSADKMAKGRWGVSHQIGELHGGHKLTEDDVLAIINNTEDVSQRVLALRYGVSKSTISVIKRGIRWKHLGSDAK